MKKIKYCIAIFQLAFCVTLAQELPYRVKVIPPSPEAAQLAKYADVPVSLYSGTPNINIPIYTLTERGMTLPVSLSYHASAHKVETIAPRTGLGWSLNAGGVITRSLKGAPDEYKTGLVQGFLAEAQEMYDKDNPCKAKPDDCIGGYDRRKNFTMFRDLADGCRDAEPDLFYFNVSGFTGSFQFDWHGNLVIASEHPVKIVPIGLNPNNDQFIQAWKMTAPNGVQYTFAAKEYQSNNGAYSLNSYCGSEMNALRAPQSWFLTEMYNPNTDGRIYFEYAPYSQKTTMWAMAHKVHDIIDVTGTLMTNAPEGEQKIDMTISGQYLKTIRTSSGQTSLHFTDHAIRRMDYGENNQDNQLYPLGNIIVQNIHNTIIDLWTFDYTISSIDRLKLKSAQKRSANQEIPPYLFEYNDRLPSFTSRKQDHWGFYNNNGASTLIPQTTFGVMNPIELSGADRSPNASRVTYGMLKKITYPTGGTDVFTFESHDYSFIQNQELTKEETYTETKSAGVPLWPRQTGDNIERVPFTKNIKGLANITVTVTYLKSDFGGGRQKVATKLLNKTTGETILDLSTPGFQMEPDWEDEIKRQITLRYTKLLAEGDYELIARMEVPLNTGPDEPTEGIRADISWEQGSGVFITEKRKGGGARIAKIERSYKLGNPNKITRYSYRMEENGTIKSTGSLLESEQIYAVEVDYCDTGGGGGYCGNDRKLMRSSQNRSALGTTHGSHVGYRNVTVWHGENGENGKSVHHFTSPYSHSDQRYNDIPFPPPTTKEYRRGLLTRQEEYTAQGDLVRKRTYSYYNSHRPNRGYKVGWLRPSLGPYGGLEHVDRLIGVPYDNGLGYTQLKQTKETTFYKPNFDRSFTKTINYTYSDTHKQLIEETTTDSKDKKIITLYRYPPDYPRGIDPALDAMQDRNQISPVIEKLSLEESIGQRALLSGTKTSYSFLGQQILPTTLLTARITDPILTGDPFATADDLYETRYLYNDYGNYGNLIEQSQPYGNTIAYKWDARETYPIAQVVNAKADEAFYTSFEDDGTTGNAKTGTKYFDGSSYTIPPYKVPSGNDLTMTYWYYKDGSWQLQKEIPFQAIISHPGASRLDEIRVYPQDAHMITYTYEPLVGITSVTDPNHKTRYFEYDAFNRLQCIKDHNQDILECYEYQYQQELPYTPKQ